MYSQKQTNNQMIITTISCDQIPELLKGFEIYINPTHGSIKSQPPLQAIFNISERRTNPNHSTDQGVHFKEVDTAWIYLRY